MNTMGISHETSGWDDPTRVSLRQLDKKLQRQERSLYNCINSILHDRRFIDEIKCLYPSLPAIANLRCGLWYLTAPDGTCYFKSTDGHNNNWSFSTTRLNLHVVEIAAANSGAVIVDATRKGKMAPDAFSKTIPIWACVINRAVASWRCSHSYDQDDISGDTGEAARPALQGWDTELHLPLWISSVERGSIEARLDGFAEQLEQIGVDIGRLSRLLVKPLRPLWVSQDTRIWTNMMPDPAEFAFFPLLLVSASTPIPASQQRSSLWRSVRMGKAVPESETGDQGSDGSQTYCYVPGAGDDEETWAAGLTPELLSQHWRRLVAAGPPSAGEVATALVAAHLAVKDEQSAGLSFLPGSTTGAVVTDEHHPLPMGLQGSCMSTGAFNMSAGDPGWITDTGVALGSWEAARKLISVCRNSTDAILNCGLRQPVGCLPAAADTGAETSNKLDTAMYCWLPIKPTKADRSGLQRVLGEALRFVWQNLHAGRRVLIHCDDGYDTCVAVAVAVMLACFSQDGRLLMATEEGTEPLNPALEISKEHVKQRLAFVCQHYPIARPTRGMLKQVFNYFHDGEGRRSDK